MDYAQYNRLKTMALDPNETTSVGGRAVLQAAVKEIEAQAHQIRQLRKQLRELEKSKLPESRHAQKNRPCGSSGQKVPRCPG